MDKSSVEKEKRSTRNMFEKTASLARSARLKAVRAYDSSVVSYVLKKIRENLPYIKNSIVGVFLFTFGIYSALISFFKMNYGFDGQLSDVAVGACVALISLPLIFSRGTLGTMLTYTQTGKAISESIGMRLHVNLAGKHVGRANVAFLLGVLLGTATFIYTTAEVLIFSLALLAVGVVMTYPEAAALIAAAALPMGNRNVFSWIAAVGMVAFFIKTFRGKRSISFRHHRAVAIILLFIIAASELFAGDFRFTLMMCVFFLISASDGQSIRAEKILACAIISVSMASAVYMSFDLVSVFAKIDANMSLFNVPAMVLACTALIPLGAAFLITRSGMSGKTAFLCTLVMMAFVLYNGYYIYMIVSVASIILWLFFYKRRASYVLFALSCMAYATWIWLGGSNRIAVDNLVSFIKSLNIASEDGLLYVLVGGSINDSFGAGESFFGAIISSVGVIGAVVLIAFALMLFGFILSGKRRREAQAGSLMYLRALAPAACSVVLLVCGLGVNVWAYSEVYVLFWILTGAASSIASDAEQKSCYGFDFGYDSMDQSSAEIVI